MVCGKIVYVTLLHGTAVYLQWFMHGTMLYGTVVYDTVVYCLWCYSTWYSVYGKRTEVYGEWYYSVCMVQ